MELQMHGPAVRRAAWRIDRASADEQRCSPRVVVTAALLVQRRRGTWIGAPSSAAMAGKPTSRPRTRSHRRHDRRRRRVSDRYGEQRPWRCCSIHRLADAADSMRVAEKLSC